MDTSPLPDEPHNHAGGNFYTRIPLYIRIVAGLILGVIVGTILMQLSQAPDGSLIPVAKRALWIKRTMTTLDITASMLLRLLGLIAPKAGAPRSR